MTEDIRSEFRLSPKEANLRFWIMLGGGVFLIAIGGFMFAVGELSTLPAVIGGMIPVIIGGAMAGLGFWWKNKVANDRAPRLIITATFIHATKKTARPVPWNEVRKIILAKSHYSQTKKQHRSGYLAIDVDDLKAYGPTGSTGLLAKANNLLGGGDIVVQTSSLDGSEDEIKAAILKACPTAPFTENNA